MPIDKNTDTVAKHDGLDRKRREKVSMVRSVRVSVRNAKGMPNNRLSAFIRSGSDTSKLASAWMDGRQRDGKSIYP